MKTLILSTRRNLQYVLFFKKRELVNHHLNFLFPEEKETSFRSRLKFRKLTQLTSCLFTLHNIMQYILLGLYFSGSLSVRNLNPSYMYRELYISNLFGPVLVPVLLNFSKMSRSGGALLFCFYLDLSLLHLNLILQIPKENNKIQARCVSDVGPHLAETQPWLFESQ